MYYQFIGNEVINDYFIYKNYQNTTKTYNVSILIVIIQRSRDIRSLESQESANKAKECNIKVKKISSLISFYHRIKIIFVVFLFVESG